MFRIFYVQEIVWWWSNIALIMCLLCLLISFLKVLISRFNYALIVLSYIYGIVLAVGSDNFGNWPNNIFHCIILSLHKHPFQLLISAVWFSWILLPLKKFQKLFFGFLINWKFKLFRMFPLHKELISYGCVSLHYIFIII